MPRLRLGGCDENTRRHRSHFRPGWLLVRNAVRELVRALSLPWDIAATRGSPAIGPTDRARASGRAGFYNSQLFYLLLQFPRDPLGIAPRGKLHRHTDRYLHLARPGELFSRLLQVEQPVNAQGHDGNLEVVG